MTEERIEAFARQAYEAISGVPLAEADYALDHARSLLWWHAFTGRRAYEGLPETPGVRIARMLEGQPLDLVQQVLEQVRLHIWFEILPNAKPNLFGAVLEQTTGVVQ